MKKEARPTVLVTGGTGFLGGHLVRMLASQNKAKLRVLVHSAPPAWYAWPASSTMPMKPRMSGMAEVARGSEKEGNTSSAFIAASNFCPGVPGAVAADFTLAAESHSVLGSDIAVDLAKST